MREIKCNGMRINEVRVKDDAKNDSWSKILDNFMLMPAIHANRVRYLWCTELR